MLHYSVLYYIMLYYIMPRLPEMTGCGGEPEEAVDYYCHYYYHYYDHHYHLYYYVFLSLCFIYGAV